MSNLKQKKELLQKKPKDIGKALKIFETNQWHNNECDESLNRLLLKFLLRASSVTSSQEFLQLSETLFKSNFSPRNTLITRLVMFKFIKSNDYDAAFDYYKFNIQTYGQSILELLLVRHYVNEQTLQVEENVKKLEELLEIISRKFNWNFIDNLMFWAHIMNKNYIAADKIFIDDLKRTLDISILKRVRDQSVDNKDLKHVLLSLFNIFNSSLFKRAVADFDGKRKLRADIETILQEGNRKRKPTKKPELYERK